MKTPSKEELTKERERIRIKAKELISQMEEARQVRNWELFEKLDKELDILRRKQRHVLHRLGLRKYKDDETVEYAPGQFIKAEEYYWLIDD